MIKKLKIRFVMVNMLILTLVLFSTLSGIYLLMRNSEIHMSEEIMDTLIENHKKNISEKEREKNRFEKNPEGEQAYMLAAEMADVPLNILNKTAYIVPLNNEFFDGNVGNGENPTEGEQPQDNPSLPEFDKWNPWTPWNPSDPHYDEYWRFYWENFYKWNQMPPWEYTEPPETEPPPVYVDTEPPAEYTEAVTEAVVPDVTDSIPEPQQTEPPHEEVTEPPSSSITETKIVSKTEQTTVLPADTLTDTPKSAPPTEQFREPKPEITTRYNGNLIRSHIFAEIGIEDNQILNVSYQYFFQYDDVKNEAEYDAKVRAALNNIAASSDKSGKYEIDSVSYRYKLSKTLNGKEYFVILLDRSIEISTLNRLLFTFIIIGCVGIIIVFFISLFLANWAIKPIEVAWNRQKQFIADASHELKTPLTVISTNTDVLLSNPNDYIKDQERWLRYIKSETARMSKLVSELLYIAKSDSNEIKMEMSEFDISNTISSICLIFEPLVFEAGRELVSDITQKLRYYGDEDRIKQLITILLDNAVKYSIVDSQISVSLFKNNQGRIKFCVSNKCEELSEENISKLFDRFYRVDSSRNSGTGGNGLGLNIAQTITEAHNGQINVNYNYGMISFTVTL